MHNMLHRLYETGTAERPVRIVDNENKIYKLLSYRMLLLLLALSISRLLNISFRILRHPWLHDDGSVKASRLRGTRKRQKNKLART